MQWRIAIIWLACLFCLTPVAHSQVPDTTYQSSPVIITAQRKAVHSFDLVESVSILNRRDLLENSPRSLPEALMGVTGVWMQKTNHGGGSPFVRGLTGNQTLLLVDGIRLNNSTYRYGPNQYLNTVDPLSLDRVEVVRGSGSVQYGTDALGGVVNLLSRSPKFREKTTLTGGLYGKWMSHDMEWTGRAEVELGAEKFALLAGFNYKDFGDLRAGGDLGTESPSAYQEQDVDLAVRIRPASNQTLTVAYQLVRQQGVGRYDQVAQRGYEIYQFNPQNRSLAYARWEANLKSGFFRQLEITLSCQHSLEGREKRKIGSPATRFEEDEITTLGVSASFQSIFSDKWSAVSGVEAYQDLVHSSAMDRTVSTGTMTSLRGLYPDDSKARNLGIFTLHTFRFQKWQFQAGLRFNTVDLDIQDETFGDLGLTPSALVGNLGMLYAVHPQHHLTAAVNTAFRAPNVNDLSSFGSFDSGIEVPSSELAPERTLTGELGYKLNTARIQAEVVGYYSRLFNLISRVPATYQGSETYLGEKVYQKANVAEAYIYGAEADIRLSLFQNLQVYSGVAYTFGENPEKTEPLRRIPPLNGRTGIRYAFSNGCWAKVEGWYAATQDRLSGGDIDDHRIPDGGTPGWAVLNIQTGYVHNWFRIAVMGQNLFNEAYRTHGSGVDGYGRSVWVSIGITPGNRK